MTDATALYRRVVTCPDGHEAIVHEIVGDRVGLVGRMPDGPAEWHPAATVRTWPSREPTPYERSLRPPDLAPDELSLFGETRADAMIRWARTQDRRHRETEARWRRKQENRRRTKAARKARKR